MSQQAISLKISLKPDVEEREKRKERERALRMSPGVSTSNEEKQLARSLGPIVRMR
jgi:hypothetical protein